MYVLLEETRRAVHDLQQTMGSDLPVSVCSADELLQQLRPTPASTSSMKRLNSFFVALQDGRSTYAEETIHLLEQILDFTGMTRRWPSSLLRRLIIRQRQPVFPRRGLYRLAGKDFLDDGCPL